MKMMIALVGALFAADAPASLFDGTWRVDTGSMTFAEKPERIVLRNGIYESGAPGSVVRVRADGRFHATADSSYTDAVAIAVTGARTVRETSTLRGKVAYVTEYTVSPDGRTLTSRSTDLTKLDGKPVASMAIRHRVGPAVRGAHPISGQWQIARIDVATADYLLWTMKLSRSTFTQSFSDGSGYTAVIGGPAVAIRGDTAGGKASIAMPRPDTIVMRASLNGVVGSVMTMVVTPDGKRIDVSGRSLKLGKVTTFVLYKQ